MSHNRHPGTAYALRKARPIIAAQLPAPCVNRCKLGGIVHPHEAWDVGHVVDKDAGGADTLENLGPAHVACNRSDGGRIGAARTNAQRRAGKKFRAW